ncbi:MAG: DUF4331 domain-containing protein [Pyrinomonadaceae bacterium]
MRTLIRLKTVAKKMLSLSLVLASSLVPAFASSHSEAPLTARDRFVDNTDTYAFRSIEHGREDFVTLIANYIPFQQPSGGPHFFRWDDTVLYEIKIDNTGDGVEDIVYQFRFKSLSRNGDTVLGHSAVNQDAVIKSLHDPDYNEAQSYTVTRVDKRTHKMEDLIKDALVPPANIGPRVTPDYEKNLGERAVYNLRGGGKVFAGQRDEGFFVDVGGVFDALNLKSVGMNGGYDYTKGFNVSSIALEVPIKDVTRSGKMPKKPTDKDAVIGVWATASRQTVTVINTDGSRKTDGDWRQVSRLGNPLVNEVVIPLKLKDAFNSLSPKDDAVAAPAVLDPELPKIMKAVYGIKIPTDKRQDLVAIFATGIPVNPVTGPDYTTFLSDGKPHEYLRLNVAIPATPFGHINALGLLGGDVAGFPNGRRVQDDVVDIALRAVAGGTPFTPDTNVAPNNTLGDGVSENDVPFLHRFPYLAPPQAGNNGNP